MDIEVIIKIVLSTILFIGILLIWLLPKSKFAKHIKMNSKIFISTNITGIICSIVGLIATFTLPDIIIEKHLMWLIIFPYVIFAIYWQIVRRVQKKKDICDEKQEYDMNKAATTTLGLTLMIMVAIFILCSKELIVIQGILWFPYYFYTTIFLYSITTLFYYKKDGKTIKFI